MKNIKDVFHIFSWLQCNRSSEFGFQKYFSRNVQFHRRDPIYDSVQDLKSSPKLAKGSKIVNLFILITQFGFCCCYFVFMSANIRQVIYEYTPDGSKIKELLEHEDDANRVIMAILAVPICLICSVRNLGKFIGFVSHGSCDHFQFRSSGTLFRDSKCIHSSICRNHFLISGAKSSKSSGREFSKSSKL